MTPKYTEIAYLRMSGLTYREIGEKYNLSGVRIQQIVTKYFRRCKSEAKELYQADRYDHPNIDIIKAIYEEE